jgi:hypothetical protein
MQGARRIIADIKNCISFIMEAPFCLRNIAEAIGLLPTEKPKDISSSEESGEKLS